ncbi:hypothetical protein [Klebsiella phage vB_KvaP_F4M1D]|nr:hypothetical protein [Klebsiella phage vB_KvaP_F4M1D]
MSVLKLNIGERVRNINAVSKRKDLIGVVVNFGGNVCLGKSTYEVEWSNGEVQSYLQCNAHKFLEKVEQPRHDGRQAAKVLTFAARYGIGMAEMEAAWKELRELCAGITITCGVHDELQFTPKRRVLKKVRRNVITGKTQDDHVKALGHARGVEEFNTRALGRSTGQALRAIGSAMCNPGVEVEISGVDHFLESNNHGRVNRHQVDRDFRGLVRSLVGDMKGFTFTPTHIVFNPIVTEEVYVE